MLTRCILLLLLFLYGAETVAQTATSSGGDPTSAAIACREPGNDLNAFAGCWSRAMMSEPQKAVADCLSQSTSLADFSFCVAGNRLSPQEQRIVACSLQSGGNFGIAAACSGLQYLDPEQQRLAGCVISNGSNAMGAAVCAGGRSLSPEQVVVAECAVETGGQPYAFVGCVGGQLTANELQKCITSGVGGSGCFGDNNTLVKAVRDAWQGVSGGSNSVMNRPQQIFGGRNSVFNNPGQLAGGPNSMINNPGQILGGPNSVFHASPPPIALGSVGGHRVCIPWC